jgi:hypothetical protein
MFINACCCRFIEEEEKCGYIEEWLLSSAVKLARELTSDAS